MQLTWQGFLGAPARDIDLTSENITKYNQISIRLVTRPDDIYKGKIMCT